MWKQNVSCSFILSQLGWKKDERRKKKENLMKIGQIGTFDRLWSDSLARILSTLKVPVALLSEEVS